MTWISTFKNKTPVRQLFVAGAFAAVSALGLTASGDSTTTTQIRSADDIKKLAETICNGQGLAGDALKKCIAEKIEAQAMGTGASGGKCEQARKPAEEAQTKYIEICGKAGFQESECLERGSKCAKVIADAEKRAAELSRNADDDDDSRETPNCSDLYPPGCPAAAARDVEQLTQREKDKKEELQAKKDHVKDLDEQLRNLQEDELKEMQKMMDAQADLKKLESEAMQNLEKMLAKNQSDKVAAVQQVRRNYLDIDIKYAGLRGEINKSEAAIFERQQTMADRCDAKATTDFCSKPNSKVSTAEKARVCGQPNAAPKKTKHKSMGSAVSAKRRISSELTKLKNKCIDIEKNSIAAQRTLIEKTIQDQQALLEQSRTNVVMDLQEAELLAEYNKNLATKQMNEKMLQYAQDLQKQQQQIMQTQQMRGAQKIQLQQEVANEKAALEKIKYDEKIATVLLNCSQRASGGSSTGKGADEKAEAAVAVAGLLNRLKSACERAVRICSATVNDDPYECPSYVKDTGTDKGTGSTGKSTTNRTNGSTAPSLVAPSGSSK